MTPNVIKNVYVAEYKHTMQKNPTNGEFNTSKLNVVAIDFSEAVKKAEANKDKVSTGKEDPVELIIIGLLVTIDAE